MTSYLVTNVGLNCSQEGENTSAGHKNPDILQNIPRKLWNFEVAVWWFGKPSKKMAPESSYDVRIAWIPLLTKRYWRKNCCQYELQNIFQQDGAPCHKSRLVTTLLDKAKICVLSDWPAQSPDLNAIESLWRDLKARVSSCRPGNIETLWRTCEEQWTMMPTHVIQNLYKSMPRRIQEVIKMKGMNTKY